MARMAGMTSVARIWPSPILRARLPGAVVGEVLLAVLLAVTLAFSWRDGVPSSRFVDAVGPTQSGIALMQVSGNNLYSGKPSRVATAPVVTAAPPPEPLIPTAPPVQLLIAALDVHRPVEAVTVGNGGFLNVPVNAWNAGWYRGSPVPGAPGDTVIEGHAGYPGQPMIFGRLAKLRTGDRIVVVLSDGSRRLFLVDSMATLPVGSAPPGMAEPYGLPRLTLITCTGHFDKSSYSYSERLVVEATYAGLA